MDTGLQSLVAVAKFHQIAAESSQLHHELGQPGHFFTDNEILLAAKSLTLNQLRGIIDAEVISISADAIADDFSGKEQGLVYKMRLKMKSKHLYVNGQWIAWLVESCPVWR